MTLEHQIYRIILSVYCAITIFVVPYLAHYPSPEWEVYEDHLAMEMFFSFSLFLHYSSFYGVLITYTILVVLYCEKDDHLLRSQGNYIRGLAINYMILATVTFFCVNLYLYFEIMEEISHGRVQEDAKQRFYYSITETGLLVGMIVECSYVFYLDDVL